MTGRSTHRQYFSVKSIVAEHDTFFFKRVFIAGLVAFFTVMILIFSITTHVAAGEGETPAVTNATISYESYYIKEGDTLWGIASEYKYGDYSTREFIDRIKTLNGLDKDSIKAGYYVLIPVCTYY